MKSLLLPLVALLTITRAFAAAPDQVAGYIYYESSSGIGAGDARSSSTTAIVLKNDGTFTGLFRNSFAPFFTVSPSNPGTGAVNDGTYTYVKVDDQTSTLTLSFPLDGSGGRTRTLRFDSDRSGSITRTDSPFLVIGASFSFSPLGARAPLANCSNRSFVRAGGTAFTGFVIADPGARVLVRAVGPTLAAFGVTGALRNPALTIVRASTNSAIALNDDWSALGPQALSRTASVVGAFPLPEDSKDAAVILTLGPGAYIAQVSSPDTSDAGEALIEVYLLP